MARCGRHSRAGSVGMEGHAHMPTDRTSILGGFRGAGAQYRFHREVLYGLRHERELMIRSVREHRRAFVRARTEARRHGRQLLKVLDNLPRPV